MSAHRCFEHVVTGAVVVNSALMLAGLVFHDELLEHLDTMFVLAFAVELAVRIVTTRGVCLRNPWGVFDAFVIVVALLPVIGDSLNMLRAARFARFAQVSRHMTGLRLWRVFA